MRVAGSNANLSADAAAVMTGNVNVSSQTDFLTNTTIAQNDTLTINAGGAGVQNITLGIGGGEVTTIAEPTTALSGLTGVSASVDADGNITVTADNATEAIVIGGSTSGSFGLGNTTPSPLFTSLAAISANQADRLPRRHDRRRRHHDP